MNKVVGDSERRFRTAIRSPGTDPRFIETLLQHPFLLITQYEGQNAMPLRPEIEASDTHRRAVTQAFGNVLSGMLIFLVQSRTLLSGGLDIAL